LPHAVHRYRTGSVTGLSLVSLPLRTIECMFAADDTLAKTTFVVIDLETTGISADDCRITEIGAVKMRGGQVIATIQSLVNPGIQIPLPVAQLTGITSEMVTRAPSIQRLLGALTSFVADAIVVGHNIRFDLAFLSAAAGECGRTPLANRTLDTRELARRVIDDGLSDFRLQTVAAHLGVAHRPTHRALDDALATADVLQALIERSGITGLDGLTVSPEGVVPMSA
jgi:DNA polymerase-3 subunit epsilon